MALELIKNVPSKRKEIEALDLMAGADDSILVNTLETFSDGEIVAFVINSAGTVTTLEANDTLGTNVAGAGLTAGSKNIVVDLAIGTFMAAGNYRKSRTWKSITMGTASAIVYYNYTKTNAG